MPKLEDLELKIKQTGAIQATNIGKLAENLLELSAAVKSFPKDTAKNLAEVNDAVKNIDTNKATAISKVATAIKNFGSKANDVDANAAGTIAAIGAAIEQMVDSIDVTRLNSISEALVGFKNAVGALNGIKGRAVSATATAPVEIPSAGDTETTETISGGAAQDLHETSAAADEASEKLANVREILKEMGKSAGSALKSAAKSLGNLAKSAGSAVWDRFHTKLKGITSAAGNLFNSFKRIAMYRALRTAIKAITTGFSEGIKHVYQWSQLVGDSFTKSMDSMATSAHYLRDSLGAMASPLIDALAPAIEVLVEHFVNLLNVVNQFISALTGKDTWRKAVRTPTTYSGAMKEAAENTKKATKAQKELSKALQGFDELNLLTTSEINARKPTASAGTTPEVSAGEFETDKIADWIKDIKDAIEKGDWKGAGKLLADKLNGMIANWDAEAFGKKIGQKFQNAIDFYLGFMKNFDWSQLGIKAGTFINGVLSNINPTDLGEAMVAKIKGALKFLANFTWTVNLTPLGEALGAAFNSLFSADTMNDLGLTISGLINDAIDIGVGFVTTADFKSVGENIMSSLFTAIKNVDWAEAGTFVADLGTGLLDAVLSAIDYLIENWRVIFDAIGEFLSALFKKLGEWIDEKLEELIPDWAKEFFGTKATAEDRKDTYVGSSTPSSDGATVTRREKVNIEYESNYGQIKSEIEMLAKMKAKPTVTMQTKNFQATKDSLKKISKGRTVMIYAKKDKDSFDAVTKSLNKITIDRTATIKFKPVIETQEKAGTTVRTIASLKQLTKLAGLAEGGYLDSFSQGTVFVAGELPGQTEMLGTINGRTGVAGGKEITGIADAVYDTGQTEAELLRQQNQLLRQLLAKSGNVTLAPSAAAGRWVAQSQAAYSRATGG